jgi:hypothetical protein
VLVSVSNSSPYAISDGPALMRTFFGNSNIDLLSPMLYSNGIDLRNHYNTSEVTWQEFTAAKAKIIPSIVKASLYPDAQKYFSAIGVPLHGYIQWNNK